MAHLKAFGIELLPLQVQVYRAQLRYFGHVSRMGVDHLQRKILFSRVVGARWDPHAPRISHISQELFWVGIGGYGDKQ